MTTGYYAIAIQLDLNWWFQPALAINVQYAFHVVWVCHLTRRLIMPSLLSLKLSQSPPPSFFVKYPKSGRLGTQQRHTCSALPQLPPNIFLFLRWEDASIHHSCQASGPLGAGALCGTRLISLLWLAWFGTNTPRLPASSSRGVCVCVLCTAIKSCGTLETVWDSRFFMVYKLQGPYPMQNVTLVTLLICRCVTALHSILHF